MYKIYQSCTAITCLKSIPSDIIGYKNNFNIRYNNPFYGFNEYDQARFNELKHKLPEHILPYSKNIQYFYIRDFTGKYCTQCELDLMEKLKIEESNKAVEENIKQFGYIIKFVLFSLGAIWLTVEITTPH